MDKKYTIKAFVGKDWVTLGVKHYKTLDEAMKDYEIWNRIPAFNKSKVTIFVEYGSIPGMWVQQVYPPLDMY